MVYEESRKHLKIATDGSLAIRNEHDRLFVSNSRATEFVSRWADVQKLDSKVQQLDKEVATLMAEKEEAKREREVRQERDIRFDKLYQEKFNAEEAIRQRFFGDVLVIPNEKDHPWIRRGNVDAHHGDCVRDANLYEAGSRNDPHIFQTLYGFAPSAVLNMDPSGKGVSVLNQHATRYALPCLSRRSKTKDSLGIWKQTTTLCQRSE